MPNRSSESFASRLNRWYSKNCRDLPWRQTKDPYKIWISEIMLQQTTVSAVIPYYSKWITVFPDVKSVAQAPLQRILKAWQGLGYYSRAKNIHKCAKLICKLHQGRIPDSHSALKVLPGFGPYTIGAVLSIAFNQRFPIIDANVRRVIMRIMGTKGFAAPSQDRLIFEFLEKVMPEKEMNIFNQALMELGALICRSREPLCHSCPVSNLCQAYKYGTQESIPLRKTNNIKEIHVAIAVIENDGKFFIQKRPKDGLFADLWEFPGGKVEPGEVPKIAVKREIFEELKISVTSSNLLMKVKHFYTQFKANLHVFSCETSSLPKIDKNHKWVNKRELLRYPMPAGSAKIVEKLISKV